MGCLVDIVVVVLGCPIGRRAYMGPWELVPLASSMGLDFVGIEVGHHGIDLDQDEMEADQVAFEVGPLARNGLIAVVVVVGLLDEPIPKIVDADHIVGVDHSSETYCRMFGMLLDYQRLGLLDEWRANNFLSKNWKFNFLLKNWRLIHFLKMYY